MLDSAMAENKKKSKYVTKTVKFGDKQFTLFSLDGVTWSSRKDELHMILERQEQERKSFNQIIGEQPADKAAEDGEAKEKDVDEDGPVELMDAEDDAILPITTEPARKPIKPRLSSLKTAKGQPETSMKISKKTDKALPAKKAPRAEAQPVVAAPKSRVSSKPAKKLGKIKAKKRA
ncbi:MAG: hypothetical protein J0M12_00850 [Deltaproteobacteria bacterium]|nr:hypothetical protein [Deltaproteobacteria bacterium]